MRHEPGADPSVDAARSRAASAQEPMVGQRTEPVEEALRRNEQQLRDLIETIPAMAWSTLPDGSNVFVSRRWTEYTGLSAEDTAGWGWRAAVHPDDIDRYIEKWHASLATGESFEDEARFRRAADGEYRWFLAGAQPLRDEGGNILNWYGILTDIEDRKRAEQAQHDSEEQWRATFESNPTMYFMVDEAARILLVNGFGASQLGYDVSELIGTPVLDVFVGSDRERVRKNAERCFQNPDETMRWEARKVRKDGTMLWVRETARAVVLKGRPVLLVVCEDITERKHVREALRASEERFRTLVQFSFDVYWETDAQHRFTFQEFGEGLADAPAPGSEIGKTRWEVPYLEPDEEGWRKHRATLDAHLPFRDFEVARPTADGGKRYVVRVGACRRSTKRAASSVTAASGRTSPSASSPKPGTPSTRAGSSRPNRNDSGDRLDDRIGRVGRIRQQALDRVCGSAGGSYVRLGLAGRDSPRRHRWTHSQMARVSHDRCAVRERSTPSPCRRRAIPLVPRPCRAAARRSGQRPQVVRDSERHRRRQAGGTSAKANRGLSGRSTKAEPHGHFCLRPCEQEVGVLVRGSVPNLWIGSSARSPATLTSAAQLVHPDDRDRTSESCSRRHSGERPKFAIEYRIAAA